MSDKPLWPLDDQTRENVQGIIEKIKQLDAVTGGWSAKSDCRQTGLSLHVRFDKKVDITVTLQFLNLLEQAPGMLVNACERLLAGAAAEV